MTWLKMQPEVVYTDLEEGAVLLQPSVLNRALMPTGRLLFRDALVPQMLERYAKFLLIDTHGGRWRAIRTWFQSNKRFFGR